MAALHQSEVGSGAGTQGNARNLVDPRPRRVYDGTGRYLPLTLGSVQGRSPGIPAPLQRHDFRTGQDLGPTLACVHRGEDDHARIFHPAIRIFEPPRQPVLQDCLMRRTVEPNGAAARQGPFPTPQGIVKKQSRTQHPFRPHGAVMRKDETQWPHDMRRCGQQHFALVQGFGDQSELVLFQIAEPAVDQLGAGGRCMRGQIVLLGQQHGQAAPRRVASDAGTVDPPADDQQVEAIIAGQEGDLLRHRVSRSRRGRTCRDW